MGGKNKVPTIDVKLDTKCYFEHQPFRCTWPSKFWNPGHYTKIPQVKAQLLDPHEVPWISIISSMGYMINSLILGLSVLQFMIRFPLPHRLLKAGKPQCPHLSNGSNTTKEKAFCKTKNTTQETRRWLGEAGFVVTKPMAQRGWAISDEA